MRRVMGIGILLPSGQSDLALANSWLLCWCPGVVFPRHDQVHFIEISPHGRNVADRRAIPNRVEPTFQRQQRIPGLRVGGGFVAVAAGGAPGLERPKKDRNGYSEKRPKNQ